MGEENEIGKRRTMTQGQLGGMVNILAPEKE
jgi:hypothetical protein